MKLSAYRRRSASPLPDVLSFVTVVECRACESGVKLSPGREKIKCIFYVSFPALCTAAVYTLCTAAVYTLQAAAINMMW